MVHKRHYRWINRAEKKLNYQGGGVLDFSPRNLTNREREKTMDKKVATLIDKFGEIPNATGKENTWTINLDRTRVSYDGGDTIYVEKRDGDFCIALPLTAPLRDFTDAANFVMFCNEKDAPLWELERAIIRQYPLCSINHGRESETGPTDSFISDTNFWIKVRVEGKLFTLAYWGDELDGLEYATSVDAALARLIEMDRFWTELDRETAETRSWTNRQN